jgi:hypothetical protein
MLPHVCFNSLYIQLYLIQSLSLFYFLSLIKYCISHWHVLLEVRNYLKACQKLGVHVLLLEPNHDVYLKLLQPLLNVN